MSTVQDLRRLGEPALIYLLATTPGQLQARLSDPPVLLSVDQEAVLQDLHTLARHGVGSQALGSLLSNPTEDSGLSTGNRLRERAGGEVARRREGLPPLEATLADLVLDAYPALLLEAAPPQHGGQPTLPLLLHGNPKAREFERLVMAEPQLSTLFPQSDGPLPSGNISRSTGSGGLLQVALFAETLIAGGWRRAATRVDEPTPMQAIDTVLDALRLVRDAITGCEVAVPILIGIAGLRLPDAVDAVNLGWAMLRRLNRGHALFTSAAQLRGSVSAQDDMGQQVDFRLAGDVVLEIEMPYAIAVSPNGAPIPSPGDINAFHRTLDDAVDDLRLALVLAMPERRPAAAATWRTVLDPIVQGSGISYGDTRGLNPVQLDAEALRDTIEWAKRVHEARVSSVRVAIRRMLTAIAEDRLGDDGLIDAVIVWENLFGARQETVRHVTGGLAGLLATSNADRREKVRRYKQIYDLRSKVVHGTDTDPDLVYQTSHEAVGISISALRAIFSTHRHLLSSATSEERSLKILVEGECPTTGRGTGPYGSDGQARPKT